MSAGPRSSRQAAFREVGRGSIGMALIPERQKSLSINMNYDLHYVHEECRPHKGGNLSVAKSRSRAIPPADAVRPALQRRSREKRDLLIKAGVRIFARDGYEGARVADIAQDAGISVGVFYQRFKDKRGFFSALEAEFWKRGTENWDGFCESADPQWTVAELIIHMIRNLSRVVVRNEGFFRALITVSHKDKTVFPPGLEMDRYGAKVLYKLLASRGFIEPGVVDEEQVYFAIAGISKIMILMTLFASGGYRASDEYSIQELTAMFARYLRIEL